VYLCTSIFNICKIFQLKGDTLDNDKVLEEVKSMIQLAKKNGKEVDENQLKSAMSNCGNQGKYYCTLGIFSCFNFVVVVGPFTIGPTTTNDTATTTFQR